MFVNRIIRPRRIPFVSCIWSLARHIRFGQYKLRAVTIILIGMACFLVPFGCKGSPELSPDEPVPPPSPEVTKIYIEAEELAQDNKWERCVALLYKTLPKVKNPGQEEQVLLLLAEGYFQLKEYEDADELYDTCLTSFPKTEHLNEVIERKYQIGFAFFTGQAKTSLWGWKIVPATERGLTIIRDILQRYPYAAPSATYQFKLGEHFYKKKLYELARDEYEIFIRKYPQSPFLPKAQFQLAETYFKEYQGIEYDLTGLEKAKEGFQGYLERYPEHEWVEQGQEKLKSIISKEAEREYTTGCYYLSVDKKKSADIYFKSVIRNYPETDWSEKAREAMAKPEAK